METLATLSKGSLRCFPVCNMQACSLSDVTQCAGVDRTFPFEPLTFFGCEWARRNWSVLSSLRNMLIRFTHDYLVIIKCEDLTVLWGFLLRALHLCVQISCV